MFDPKQLIHDNLKNFLERKNIDAPFDVSLVTNPEHGDFATNIALVVSKQVGKPPREIAEEIIKFLNESVEVRETFEKIEIAGPGFINFFLSPNYLSQVLQEIVQKRDEFGKMMKEKPQTVIVEYSSPNIAKPFTVGHLRSTIIGDALANLLEAVGNDVKRDNHLGDWGTQFGKQIYAIKSWGSEDAIENAENPVKELVSLYVKFHEEAEKDLSLEDEARKWFVKLEKGDLEAKRLWQKCIDWSFKEFDRLYTLMNVRFTENNGRGYGESFFEDKMQKVIDELREKNLLKKDEGAELVYFPNDKYPPLMILKNDGSTLYATRDLATDKFRLEKYGNDVIIINEVGIEQELYFRQLFEIEKMLGWVKEGQRIHIKHGHYRFADGKMSTRRGNVIWLEDVLKEAIKRAFALANQSHEFEGTEVITHSNKVSIAAAAHNPGLAEKSNNTQKIAIGAIKWNDLRRESKQDITFDWDDILNMQGNSGPYLQYTYVRTQSVLAKANGESSQFSISNSQKVINDQLKNENLLKTESWKLETEESKLLRFLVQYPYILEQAAQEFAPNLLCNYLFELSQKFNLFYQKHKIIGSEKEAFRLQLTKAVGQILQNGLYVLGIATVEKM